MEPVTDASWSPAFHGYLRHLLCFKPTLVEARRVELMQKSFHAKIRRRSLGLCRSKTELFAVGSEGCVDALNLSLNEMRDSEKQILEAWNSLIETTFRLLRIDSESEVGDWVPQWETRIKNLVRLAPVTHEPPAFHGTTRQSDALKRFNISEDFLGGPVDSAEAVYGLPHITFGLLPMAVPKDADNRRLVVILGLLCYLANTTDLLTLHWAYETLKQWTAPSPCQGTTMGLIATLCNRSEATCLDQIRTYVEHKFLRAIVDVAPGEGFHLLQRFKLVGATPYLHQLIADTYVEFNRTKTLLGDDQVTEAYAGLATRLEPSLMQSYLNLWLCSFSHLSSKPRECNYQSYAYAGDAMAQLLDQIHAVIHSQESESLSQDSFVSLLQHVMRSVQRNLASKASFTRSTMAIFHHKTPPKWFNLLYFQLWAILTATIYHVPYITAHLSAHAHACADELEFVLSSLNDIYCDNYAPLKAFTPAAVEMTQIMDLYFCDEPIPVNNSQIDIVNNEEMRKRCLLHAFVHNVLCPFRK